MACLCVITNSTVKTHNLSLFVHAYFYICLWLTFLLFLAHSVFSSCAITTTRHPVSVCVSLDDTSPMKMAHSFPNLNTMVPRCVSMQIMLEVKFKGHEVLALR